MATPSVTKRFSDLVAPDLLALGFTANGNKQYRRVADEVFQGLFLHVETRRHREFVIEYCAFLICGYARMGDIKSARQHAEQALLYFQTALDVFRVEFPNQGHWAPQYIDYAKALIAAIDASATDALLTTWRAVTADALKLPD